MIAEVTLAEAGYHPIEQAGKARLNLYAGMYPGRSPAGVVNNPLRLTAGFAGS